MLNKIIDFINMYFDVIAIVLSFIFFVTITIKFITFLINTGA